VVMPFIVLFQNQTLLMMRDMTKFQG
jgi:hypothetical protein